MSSSLCFCWLFSVSSPPHSPPPLFAFGTTHPDTAQRCENTHKANQTICSVADFYYAPAESHHSRVYLNMKINSQLNAAICTTEEDREKAREREGGWEDGREGGREKIKHGVYTR